MPKLSYQVLEEYDEGKNYGINITPNMRQCLSKFRKGEIVHPVEFVKEHNYDFGVKKRLNLKGSKTVLSRGISIGKKIGMLEEIQEKVISFEEFCRLESVNTCATQIRGNRYKNLEQDNRGSTRKLYMYRLWEFNEWLVGKEFEFFKIRQVDQNTFTKEKNVVTLEGLEHLLELFKESMNSDSDYIKIIKKYLNGEMHGNVSASYMKTKHSAIMAYFDRNECPLRFHYDSKILHENERDEIDTPLLSLQDLLDMLTTGRTSVLDRAVVLCKFHRGLDNVTFADRFNFQAWEQLIKYFGTEQFENWDLTKCPAPIKLTRVKTNYNHRSYIDIDAIKALQKYLKVRYQKTGKIIRIGEPIFLNNKGKPVSIQWLSSLIPRLAKNAGIQKRFKVNTVEKNEKTTHELRDLLKSTLLVCGVTQYVCELAIGHKVGDSYEKQDELYPEKSRAEYMKASKKLNIFTNISNSMNSDHEKEILRSQLDDLKEQGIQDRQMHDSEMREVRTILARLIENENIRKNAVPL